MDLNIHPAATYTGTPEFMKDWYAIADGERAFIYCQTHTLASRIKDFIESGVDINVLEAKIKDAYGQFKFRG